MTFLRFTGLQLAARAAAAGGFAVALARLLHLEYPLYALIGAVIVTDLSPRTTRQHSARRLAGTVLGAAVGASLSTVLPPGPVAIGIGILAAMVFSQLLRLQAAAKVTGYVCGIAMLDHGADPWGYAGYRVIETALGILVALAVSLVPKLIRVEPHDTPDA